MQFDRHPTQRKKIPWSLTCPQVGVFGSIGVFVVSQMQMFECWKRNWEEKGCPVSNNIIDNLQIMFRNRSVRCIMHWSECCK